MSTEKATSPPPTLPHRTQPAAGGKAGDPNVTMLYGIAGAVVAIVLGLAVTSFKMLLGFLSGAVVAVVAIFGALYYFLNIAEAAVADDKHAEVTKKSDQPILETKVRPAPPIRIYPLLLFRINHVLFFSFFSIHYCPF